MHHIDEEAAEEMIEKRIRDVRSIIITIVIKHGSNGYLSFVFDSSSLGIEETVRFIEEFVKNYSLDINRREEVYKK